MKPLNKKLYQSLLISCFIIFLLAVLFQSCQLVCGNAIIFDKCPNSEIQENLEITYEFENFSFRSPKTWKFDTTNIDGCKNYILINDSKHSEKVDNIETFTITEMEVQNEYNFEGEFEKFVKVEISRPNQSIVGIEAKLKTDYQKMAGIYTVGINSENQLTFETMAKCVLESNKMYWLNSTSHSKLEENRSICTSKEIMASFKIKKSSR